MTATPGNSSSSRAATRFISEGPGKGKLILSAAPRTRRSAPKDAMSPSSTAQQLVPQDNNENIDVYVRDMDVPLTANRKDSGAFTLVSAQNDSEAPPVYAPRRSPPRSWRRPWRRSLAEHGDQRQRPLRRISYHRIHSDLPEGCDSHDPANSYSCVTFRLRRRRCSRHDDGQQRTGGRGGWTGDASAPTARPSPGFPCSAPAQTIFLSGEDPDKIDSLLPLAALAGTRSKNQAHHRDRRP